MADLSNDYADPERERLLRVYRGWKRALLDRTIPLWLRHPSARIAIGGILIFCGAVLLPLDSAVWSSEPFFDLPAGWLPTSGRPLAIGLLALFLVNVFVVGRWLSWNIEHPEAYRSWLRPSLLVLGGIPLLGKLVLPGWRRIAVHPWALRSRPAPPVLDLHRHPRRALLRRIEEPLAHWITTGRVPLALLLGEIMALFWVSLWIAQQSHTGRLAHRDLLHLSLALHAFLFAILFFFGLGAGRLGRTLPAWQHRGLIGATFLCLLPVPWVSFVGTIPLMVLEPGMARTGALLWQAFAHRQEAGRLPLWLGLEDSLGRGWSRLPWSQRLRGAPRSVTRQPEISPAENRVLLLYDLGVFALAFDAACLGWALSSLANQWLYSALLIGSLVLFGVGVCLQTAHLVHALLRLFGPLRVLDRRPYAPYLTKTQFAFLAGLYCGFESGEGQAASIGQLVLSLCVLLSMHKGMTLILKNVLPRMRWSRARLRDEVLVVLLLWGLAIVGGLGGPLGWFPFLLAGWLLAEPLRAVLIGLFLLPCLLRPLTWQDLRNPRLRRRQRLALALLALSPVLPLGGILIPACIYIRDRLSQFERAHRWIHSASLSRTSPRICMTRRPGTASSSWSMSEASCPIRFTPSRASTGPPRTLSSTSCRGRSRRRTGSGSPATRSSP